MFSYMAAKATERGNRVVILVHRDELIDQVASTLHRFNVPCTFVAPGRRYRHNIPVVVASVFTLKNRLGLVHSPNLVIVDEAHHATLKSSWGKVISAWPGAKTVGVTATPQRLSGEGLNEVFQDMVIGPSTADLIEAGHLAPYEYFCPSEVDLSSTGFTAGDYNKTELSAIMRRPGITGSAVEHYRQIAHGKRAVIFACRSSIATRCAPSTNAPATGPKSLTAPWRSQPGATWSSGLLPANWTSSCLAMWFPKGSTCQPLKSCKCCAPPHQPPCASSSGDGDCAPSPGNSTRSSSITLVIVGATSSRTPTENGHSRGANAPRKPPNPRSQCACVPSATGRSRGHNDLRVRTHLCSPTQGGRAEDRNARARHPGNEESAPSSAQTRAEQRQVVRGIGRARILERVQISTRVGS